MEHSSKKRQLAILSWLLAAVVCVLAVIAWWSVRVDGRPLSVYDWFPLLGLSAFSLMWTHYLIGSLRRYLQLPAGVNHRYSQISSVVVLLCLLAHPMLLITALHQDGFGFPPESYFAVYTEPIMKGALMLGTIALIIFLLFELKRWLEKKAIWRYISGLQLLAMAFIFYHALVLGGELSVGWYRLVWYKYGVTLVAATLYNWWYDRAHKGGEHETK